jgi:subtilase family serine protease
MIKDDKNQRRQIENNGEGVTFSQWSFLKASIYVRRTYFNFWVASREQHGRSCTKKATALSRVN